MADITRYPLVRHLRGTTTHVQHVRNGGIVHVGTGAAFWFRPLSAAIPEVPVDDRELPLLFHARTSDFQDVAVQATVTFRLTDPTTAAGRIDFSVDPGTGPAQHAAGPRGRPAHRSKRASSGSSARPGHHPAPAQFTLQAHWPGPGSPSRSSPSASSPSALESNQMH